MASNPLVLVGKFNRFNASVENKDKLFKLVQFAARFLSWYYAKETGGVVAKSPLALKFQKLDVAILDARRLFRIFRFTNEVNRILQSTKDMQPGSLPFLLAIVRSIGYAGYFFVNPLAWFGKIGVWPEVDQAKMTRISLKFWVIGLLAWLSLDTIQYLDWRRTNERRVQMRILSPEDLEKENKKKLNDLTLNHVKNLADLQLASALAGLHSYNSPGLVGFCGFLSATIATWQAWQTC